MKKAYQLIVQKPAQMDLDEAFVWYEEKSARQGFRLIDDFEKTIERILTNPYHAGRSFEELRAASLKIFPYEIVYLIDEGSSRIVVSVFNHFKRNPLWFGGR